MGNLIIRPGDQNDVDIVQSIANHAKSMPFLGGWSMRDVVAAGFDKNRRYPINIVAELDGTVVGFSDSKDKNIRYTEYDLVAVNPDYRRQGIATAMYTYHFFRGALTGKFLMRDFTNHFNEVMQEGFLPTLKAQKIATLRNRGRNFSSANWWAMPVNDHRLVLMLDNIASHSHKITFVGLKENLDMFDGIFEEAAKTMNDDSLARAESLRNKVKELL